MVFPGYYLPDNHTWVNVLPSDTRCTGRIVYIDDKPINNGSHPESRNPATIIEVVNRDILEMAVEFVLQHKQYVGNKHGKTVAVLNMACSTVPGGGYKSGRGAQDENLHRRTNMSEHLDVHGRHHYP